MNDGAPRQSPTGTAALVLGILGLTALPLIGSVLAVIFGARSRGEAEAYPVQYTDDLGRVGRILGWVGIALFSFLALVAVLVAIAGWTQWQS